jgi:hypothetical protein
VGSFERNREGKRPRGLTFLDRVDWRDTRGAYIPSGASEIYKDYRVLAWKYRKTAFWTYLRS